MDPHNIFQKSFSHKLYGKHTKQKQSWMFLLSSKFVFIPLRHNRRHFVTRLGSESHRRRIYSMANGKRPLLAEDPNAERSRLLSGQQHYQHYQCFLQVTGLNERYTHRTSTIPLYYWYYTIFFNHFDFIRRTADQLMRVNLFSCMMMRSLQAI